MGTEAELSCLGVYREQSVLVLQQFHHFWYGVNLDLYIYFSVCVL